MKILVCISHVPDTTTRITFVDNDTKLNTAGVQFIIGPYDDYALARAVELKEAGVATQIIAINVGMSDTEPTLRKALAIGADEAVRINAFPTDARFVASQIAHYAKDKNFDMILTGRESIDFNGGLVHGMLGAILGLPSISPVMKLDLEGNKATLSREIEGGKEILEVALPFVAGCQEPIAEWKIPNMRGIMSARTKPLHVLEPVQAEEVLRTTKFQLPPPKSVCKMIDPARPEELVSLLKNEAKVI